MMRDSGVVPSSSARLLLRWLVLFRAIISPRAASTFAYFAHNNEWRGGGIVVRNPPPRHRPIPRIDVEKRRARAPSWMRESGAGIDPPPPPPPSTARATTTTIPRSPLSAADVAQMRRAADLARIGYGNTYPNPAVGCVLVRHPDDEYEEDVVVGSGFHPRAGMPHAEVFALLEACGHVEDGVSAARSVMTSSPSAANAVLDLLDRYKWTNGIASLFGDRFIDSNITAYVTLEPCCHHGRTPPCASSLIASGVRRVVVGCRDPNPKVDGGGIGILVDAGIDVRVLDIGGIGGGDADEGETIVGEINATEECRDLIRYFVRRISPREGPTRDLDDVVDGRMRRALRSIAGRMKADGSMRQVEWPGGDDGALGGEDVTDFARRVPIDVRFLEAIDGYLWDHELVLLRLNNAIGKKSGAKVLAGRVAEILDAHVAQVIGHTALLYRPAVPPILDLNLDEA